VSRSPLARQPAFVLLTQDDRDCQHRNLAFNGLLQSPWNISRGRLIRANGRIDYCSQAHCSDAFHQFLTSQTSLCMALRNFENDGFIMQRTTQQTRIDSMAESIAHLASMRASTPAAEIYDRSPESCDSQTLSGPLAFVAYFHARMRRWRSL
jgi:hypothetical protein